MKKDITKICFVVSRKNKTINYHKRYISFFVPLLGFEPRCTSIAS